MSSLFILHARDGEAMHATLQTTTGPAYAYANSVVQRADTARVSVTRL